MKHGNRFIDLAGQKFARLAVVRVHGKAARGSITWECQCDCGKAVVVIGSHLRSGNTKSCGCLNVEGIIARSTTHGHSRKGRITSEFHTWASMIKRCSNPAADDYQRYGGRGISVCERWANSFETFLSDMGPKLSPKHSIDRINNNGNYEPGNCRWLTEKDQQRNRRDNRQVEFNGRTQCISAWAEELGVVESRIRYRLNRGWTAARALTEPVRHGRVA